MNSKNSIINSQDRCKGFIKKQKPFYYFKSPMWSFFSMVLELLKEWDIRVLTVAGLRFWMTVRRELHSGKIWCYHSGFCCTEVRTSSAGRILVEKTSRYQIPLSSSDNWQCSQLKREQRKRGWSKEQRLANLGGSLLYGFAILGGIFSLSICLFIY